MQINHKIILALAIVTIFGAQFIFPAPVSAFCNSDLDCGGTVTVGVQSCMSNGVYQDYIINTCVNPGSSNSSCFATRNSQLIQACQYQCVSGSCTNSNININTGTNTQYTCISHSYEKCVGNSVYWFNSCNQKQGLVATCSASQTCQGNVCLNNATQQNSSPTAHFTKICSDNNVYWFDSLGNRQDIFQKCNTGDVCLNGTCLNSQNNNNQNLNPSNSVLPTNQPNTQTNSSEQNTNASTAAVSTSGISSIVNFIKTWWLWILVIFIITVLFVVIFRRLSSDS